MSERHVHEAMVMTPSSCVHPDGVQSNGQVHEEQIMKARFCYACRGREVSHLVTRELIIQVLEHLFFAYTAENDWRQYISAPNIASPFSMARMKSLRVRMHDGSSG